MRYIKDPMSALTHFLGFILSIFAVVSLVLKAIEVGDALHVAAFSIFGGSLVLLYLASTVYHIVKPERISLALKKVDHMMIFVLIAGTYTPICLIPLNGTVGLTMLAIIWSATIFGIFFKIFWINAPRWIYTGLYLAMGWIVVFAIYPLAKSMPAGAIAWLVGGGLAYTVGALIYATKWPKMRSEWFGFHEVFHCFVLLGSFCHFILIYQYVQ